MVIVPVNTRYVRDCLDCTIWEDGWFLLLERPHAGDAAGSGVCAVHPDGILESAPLPPPLCDHDIGHNAIVFFRLAREGVTKRMAKWPRDYAGVCVGLRHGGDVCPIQVGPLRAEPPADRLARVHHAATVVGDVVVAAPGGAGNSSVWTPKRIDEMIRQAFTGAGKTGFIVYDRDAETCRVFDLRQTVHRVELRPDGAVAAAILGDAVAFVDLT